MDGTDLGLMSKQFLVCAHGNTQQFRLRIGSPAGIALVTTHLGTGQAEAGGNGSLHCIAGRFNRAALACHHGNPTLFGTYASQV